MKLEKEQRTYDLLDNLSIPYDKYDHEALFTIEAAEELDRQLGLEICKNLFLYSKNKEGEKVYFLLVMVGHKKFRTGHISKQIAVPRMSFADEEHMEAFLGITPGSVSPLGLMNDKEGRVQLLLDKDILKEEKMAVHPCVNTATVVLSIQDLIEKFLPAVGHSPIWVDVEE